MTDEYRFFIMAGTESNVGKTTTAVYFSNVLTQLEIPHLDIDTDPKNKNFSKFLHGKSLSVNIDENASVREVFAAIVQSKLKYCIIDLKTNDHNDAYLWLQKFLLARKHLDKIKLTVVMPLTSDEESSVKFLKWYKNFNADTDFMVVLNEISGKDFESYYKITANWIKKDLPQELRLKRLEDEYNEALNIKEITLYDFLYRDFEMPFRQFFGIIPYSRLLRYYKVIKWQIEEVIGHGEKQQ